MKKGILIATLCLLLAIVGVGLYSVKSDNICKNVYVKNINIGGLTKEEAKEKIEKENEMDTFTFKYQDKTWTLDAEQAEMTYDIDKTVDEAYNVNRDKNIAVNIVNSLKSLLGTKNYVNIVVNFDEEKVEEELSEIAKEVDVEVKNATLNVVGNDIAVEKEETGLKVEVEKTIENLVKNVQAGRFEEELVVTKIEPEVVASDLEGIDTLLGSYRTILVDTSYERVENIKRAAKSNSDLIIMPGEEFSYNEHTGPRSKKNGYLSAHVIQGGEVTYGTGGGICQVSSTMFNTVLYAGLDIVSRMNHSIPSDYVPLGRDATVSDSGIDFVFKNTLKNPVFIKCYYTSGTVKCQIFGYKSDKQRIEINAVVDSVIEPDVKEQKDPTLEEGKTKTIEKGRSTRRVSTYRIYYDENGKKIKSEKVCASYYPGKTRVVAVGTKKATNNNGNNNSNGGNNNSNGDSNQGGTGQNGGGSTGGVIEQEPAVEGL